MSSNTNLRGLPVSRANQLCDALPRPQDFLRLNGDIAGFPADCRRSAGESRIAYSVGRSDAREGAAK